MLRTSVLREEKYDKKNLIYSLLELIIQTHTHTQTLAQASLGIIDASFFHPPRHWCVCVCVLFPEEHLFK